jgi:hypothetical protein
LTKAHGTQHHQKEKGNCFAHTLLPTGYQKYNQNRDKNQWTQENALGLFSGKIKYCEIKKE